MRCKLYECKVQIQILFCGFFFPFFEKHSRVLYSMTYCSKKEQESSLKDLKLLITQWDVQQRIRQKIETWSIRYNSQKISKLPIKFMEQAILYFLLNHYRTTFTSYTQDSLMRLAYSLKCSYNQLAVKVFRKGSFFQYTLVISAKLVHYFLDSRFPHLKPDDSIEGQLYQDLVSLLIGYEVDSKAYDIILGKLRKPNNNHQRKQSFRLLNDLKVCLDGWEKGNSSAKKIHRKGFHNMPLTNEEKGLQNFRLQVQQALHTKKPIAYIQKQKITKKPQKKQVEKIIHFGWIKGKNKLLNINQVSSAMSVCRGIESNSKSTTNIHLSRRRQLKQYSYHLQPIDNHPEKALAPLMQIIFNSNNKTDWDEVVNGLKRTSDHFSQKNQLRNSLSQSHFFMLPKSSLNESKHHPPTPQPQSIMEQNTTKFLAIPPSTDESIYYTAVTSPIQKQQPFRKSNSSFFFRDKQQFQTSCQLRQAKFQTKSIYFPTIKP